VGDEDVIAITAPLQLWTGVDGSSAYMVLPDEATGEIRLHAFENPRGFRSAQVECTIGNVSWRTSVFPRRDGGYFLPVKADVRRRAALEIGDEIPVQLELL
jgi:hypothetical protein